MEESNTKRSIWAIILAMVTRMLMSFSSQKSGLRTGMFPLLAIAKGKVEGLKWNPLTISLMMGKN